MNRRAWIVTLVIAAMGVVHYADAAENPPAPEIRITGKWSSDAAVVLKKWRDRVDDLTPVDSGLFNIDGAIPGNGTGRGLPGFGGSGVSGAGGLRGGRGRNFAQLGAQGARGTARPAASSPASDGTAISIPALNLPEGPPVTMDLKVDQKGALTGTIVLSVSDKTDEKYKIEKGKVEGKTFSFLTQRKFNGITFPTEWKGEMAHDDMMTAIRLHPSGAPADDAPFPLRRIKN